MRAQREMRKRHALLVLSSVGAYGGCGGNAETSQVSHSSAAVLQIVGLPPVLGAHRA